MNLPDNDTDEARLTRMRADCRTVHPDVKAAAMRAAEAQMGQREDVIRGAVLELTAGLEYVQSITTAQVQEISYETMQRSGFKRSGGWNRRYTLADARRHAQTAEIRLRNVWELLDPISPAKQAEAQRTALSNAQQALQTAIGHLQAVLNKPRTHDEQQAADTAARDWLVSIGSEPQ